MKSALRYLGSKTKEAPWITAHFPPHKIYVEPFGGSAAVLLYKNPAPIEIYNDINNDIVLFWRAMRSRPWRHALIRAIKYTPYAEAEWRQCQRRRPIPPTALDLPAKPDPAIIEHLRAYCVRSMMSYSGICSRFLTFKRNGIKRIPPQSKTWADYPSTLHQIAAALESHAPEIHNAPWQEEIRKYDSPDTLIYLDPPYLHTTRKSRQRYCNELTEADHIELLHTIGHLRSKCIISGYDSPLYNQHLPTWTKITRQYPTQSSRKAEECLWLNYPPPGLLSLDLL